ncbi:hypothetical protein R3P38DRAFT_3380216 [Favolaschia claudopus]|uniref:Uncharacterized protein n=1 Tax=Favolaschia claudopus TaxID=2862362 RepID=A0AAV9Z394_9AGAR
MISNYPTDYAETGLSLWAAILTFVLTPKTIDGLQAHRLLSSPQSQVSATHMHFSNVGAIPLGHPAVRAIDSDLKQERMSGIVVGWKHCQGKVKTKVLGAVEIVIGELSKGPAGANVFKIVAGHCEMESTGDTSLQRVQPNSEPPYILTGSRARNSTQALKLEGNLSKAGHTKLPDFVHILKPAFFWPQIVVIESPYISVARRVQQAKPENAV